MTNAITYPSNRLLQKNIRGQRILAKLDRDEKKLFFNFENV